MKLLLLVLFISTHSLAWSPVVVDHWNKLALTHKPQISESTFATFWGGMRRAIHWKHHQGEMVDLQIEGFRKELPVYLSTKKVKSELYLFYPGVFGKPDGRISPQMIDTLEKMNAHVAVVPNIVAETYLNSRPIGSGDNLQRERANQNLILKSVIRKIGEENISKVHLIAESLGCFQAANLDYKFDSMTLLWPPLYLDRSIKRFDDLITAKRPIVTNHCTFWWKWPRVALDVKVDALPTNLPQEDKDCFGAWVIAEGFVSSIKKTTKSFLLDQKRDEIEVGTFTTFVKTVLPDFSSPVETHDENLSLKFLLTKLPTDKNKIRLTSSLNDFLNDPAEWDDLKAAFPELAQNIYLHEWGGHSGPLGVDGFMDIVLANP